MHAVRYSRSLIIQESHKSQKYTTQCLRSKYLLFFTITLSSSRVTIYSRLIEISLNIESDTFKEIYNRKPPFNKYRPISSLIIIITFLS